MKAAVTRRAPAREISQAGWPRQSIWLAATSLLLAVLYYGQSLGLSFAYDDIDHLNAAADVLSGRLGFWAYLLRPHNQHVVPAFRLLMLASSFVFGAHAIGFRLLVLASHLASALLLASVARKLSGEPAAAFATALAYLLPAGFSSMVIWFPSGGTVPLALVGVTGAFAAIVHRDRLGQKLSAMLALSGVVVALACESGLVPMVLPIALLDEVERRRAGRPKSPVGFVSGVGLSLAFAATLFVSIANKRLTGAGIPIHLGPALRRAAFLVCVAPFRFFFPGTPLVRPFSPENFPIRACAFGIAVSALILMVCAATLRRNAFRLAAASLMTLVGAAGYVALVGIGRWDNRYEDLFDADRYFFPFVIPFALLAGALVASIWTVLRTWRPARRSAVFAMFALLLAAEVPLQARAVRERIPWQVYAEHAKRFEQLAKLGALLSQTADELPAGAPPLLFPDGAFYFEDVHNHRLSSRFLLYVAARSTSKRLELGPVRVDDRSERLLNPMMDQWAASIGESAPYFTVADGELRNARDIGFVRFGLGPADGSVVEGFYAWEGQYRWMARKGELHLVARSAHLELTLASPISSIGAPLPLSVALLDESAGLWSDVGTVEVREDGIRKYALTLPDNVFARVRNRGVRLRLESARTWCPRDVLPGSRDDRQLSVEVYEAGFR